MCVCVYVSFLSFSVSKVLLFVEKVPFRDGCTVVGCFYFWWFFFFFLSVLVCDETLDGQGLGEEGGSGGWDFLPLLCFFQRRRCDLGGDSVMDVAVVVVVVVVVAASIRAAHRFCPMRDVGDGVVDGTGSFFRTCISPSPSLKLEELEGVVHCRSVCGNGVGCVEPWLMELRLLPLKKRSPSRASLREFCDGTASP